MIRPFLRKLFRAIPPDVFSFVGGAVFAICVDLAREYARKNLPPHNVLLKIAIAFSLAMICFVWLGNVLRTAQEAEGGKALSREQRLANIGDRLRLLCILFFFSLLFTGLGFYLVFWS